MGSTSRGDIPAVSIVAGTPTTETARHLIDVTPGGLQERILDATLRCLGRWGTIKTTLDDVAREAGCSRATVYRAFPAGRDALFVAAGERELLRALHELAERAATAPDRAEQLSGLLAGGVSAIRDHKVLQYLCEHEPGVILPYVSFDGIDPLLTVARVALAPQLERFLDRAAALATAEWLARIVISFGFSPQGGVDLTDPAEARRFVDLYVLAGLTTGRPTHPAEPEIIPPGKLIPEQLIPEQLIPEQPQP